MSGATRIATHQREKGRPQSPRYWRAPPALSLARQNLLPTGLFTLPIAVKSGVECCIGRRTRLIRGSEGQKRRPANKLKWLIFGWERKQSGRYLPLSVLSGRL